MNYENGFICHITIISYASIKFDDYILGLLGTAVGSRRGAGELLPPLPHILTDQLTLF